MKVVTDKKKCKSLKDIAYFYIKKRIINCLLKPGEIIDEKQHASDLNMSRTPVREALNNLAAEGLVTIVSRRSISVSFLRIKHISDIYEMRGIIEPEIILRIQDKFDKSKLEQFEREFDSTEMISATDGGRDLDSEFHMYLAGCTENEVLVETEERLMAQCQRIRVLSSFADSTRDVEARKEHIDMIKFLLSDDIVAARDVCISHLEKSMERYRTVFLTSTFIV